MEYTIDNTQPQSCRMTFLRAELLYDIGNLAYVEGDLAGDDAHAAHQIFDVTQQGNVDRVTRILNLAFAACVEALYPYTKKEDDGTDRTDTLSIPESYTITLTLPPGFSATTLDLLAELIHEYIVCRVMADWLSITKPDSQANWETKAAAARQRMQTALMSRRGNVRRRTKPF